MKLLYAFVVEYPDIVVSIAAAMPQFTRNTFLIKQQKVCTPSWRKNYKKESWLSRRPAAFPYHQAISSTHFRWPGSFGSLNA